MPASTINFSTSQLDILFKVQRSRLRLGLLSTGAYAWQHPTSDSSLFGIHVDGIRYDATNMDYTGWQEDAPADGIRHGVFIFHSGGIQVDWHLNTYAGSALIECWPVIHNQGEAPFQIERVDSFSLNLQTGEAELLSFTGNWGAEYEPQHRKLSGEITLESRSGRSSKSHHPWIALTLAAGHVLSAAVAWSGNWVMRLEPLPEKGYRLCGGLHDWQFSKILYPGETMQGVPSVMAVGKTLDEVSHQYARVGRQHWYPYNTLAGTLPIEWNHWWPYEDAEINEDVFRRNVEKASQMGFEVCTLDAGWFGPSDAGAFWYDTRGDWHLVNERRFPGGIRQLVNHVHTHGMKFGIWCEIEGLGVNAQLGIEHEDYIARRDGEHLGYVCFGNPQVQAWAYATLRRLTTEYDCDWIKIDFNLDPSAGCNRSDHGHQTGDGLFEHYQGTYRTLERIRKDFPEVVLENCSSGGLRIDLGMLRHTHMTYLSDPDYPVHGLQVFWGASTMLAPNVLLHWTFSDWRHKNPPPQQTFKPHNPTLTQKQWDYYTRISMLGLYGLSQKLPDLPEWLSKRIIEQNAIYKNHVRRFVKEANLYRLTEQPRRSGKGERWAAFQYSLPNVDEHLLFVFRLPGAEPERRIALQNLQPGRTYTVQGLEGEPGMQCRGNNLMGEGLLFTSLDEEESMLLRIF